MSDFPNPSSSSSRPQYVPRGKRNRQQQQQRFHGAFTGGFSAGFFNTVGSKEGWKPRPQEEEEEESTTVAHDNDDNDSDEIASRPYRSGISGNDAGTATTASRKRRRPQRQRLEDFMDEQDHDEWGGPTSVRKEYNNEPPSSTKGGVLPPAAQVSERVADNGSSSNGGDQGEAIFEHWMKATTVEPPANVGYRLLRVLGWRDGNSSAAYVPADDNSHAEKGGSGTTEELPESAVVILSRKKLRKVQLQQTRVKIPPPKLDTCGLGYEPYQNAPEFKAYQERRQKLAKQRAKLVAGAGGGGGGHTSNVYRVSDVLGNHKEDHNGNDHHQTNEKSRNRHGHQNDQDADDDDAYVAYETVEDFIGKKSVGGFALREDEDDAYDDDNNPHVTKVSDKVRLDTEEYNNVIYEHNSSDDDNDDLNHNHTKFPMGGSSFERKVKTTASATNTTPKGIGNNGADDDDVAGALSSFASTAATMTTSNNSTKGGGGVTSDGRPPLPGFVLGGAFIMTSSHSNNIPKRYRGPDIPRSYQMTRHTFGPNEHPMVLKALSRAAQLEAVDQKRRQALDEALRLNATSNAPSKRLQQQQQSTNIINKVVNNNNSKNAAIRSRVPMAGGAFVGLAAAMKNRFTSVAGDDGSDKMKREAGLRMPSKSTKDDDTTNSAKSVDDTQKTSTMTTASPVVAVEKELKITRTMHPFTPHRLLCKRFRVPVPGGVSSTNTTSGTNNNRLTEASYFQQEILNVATAGTAAAAATTTTPKQKDERLKSIMASLFNPDGTMKDDAVPDDGQKDAGEERPSLTIYKSIFEPQSDEDEESETSSSSDKDKPSSKDTGAAATTTDHEKPTTESDDNGHHNKDLQIGGSEEVVGHGDAEETAIVQYTGRDKKKKKRSSKSKKRRRDRKGSHRDSDSEDDDSEHSRRRHRRKRSRSVSSDDTDLSRDSSNNHDRKRRRDRKDSKKKRKHKHKKKKRSSKRE